LLLRFPNFLHMNIKFRRFINSAFILGPMTMLMACIGVLRNFGMHSGWWLKIITTWLTMFPVAFTAGLVIIPFANKLTNRIKFEE